MSTLHNNKCIQIYKILFNDVSKLQEESAGGACEIINTKIFNFFKLQVVRLKLSSLTTPEICSNAGKPNQV